MSWSKSESGQRDWPDEGDIVGVGDELRLVRARRSGWGVLLALGLMVGGLILVVREPSGRDVGPIVGQFRRVAAPVRALAFAPGGRGLVLGRSDGTLEAPDRASGRTRVTPLGTNRAAEAWAITPDGRTLAVAGPGPCVTLWDVDSGEASGTIDTGPAPVGSLAFASDGRTLATGALDGSVATWDVDTARPTARTAGHEREVRSLAFASDGRTLASGSLDGPVKLWDAGTGALRESIPGEGRRVRSLAIAPDGRTLAIGLGAGMDGRKGFIVLRDLAARRELARIVDHASFAALAFSPDGRTLAGAGGDRAVKLWDARTGREVARIEGHEGFIDALAFSPDGRSLATAGQDPIVGLFEVGPALDKAARHQL